MVRMDGAEVRKERIAQINRMVHAALYENKEIGYVSLSDVASKIEVEMGLRHDKIMEILRPLGKQRYFSIDEENDKIMPIATA
jgi:hypothetical protein